MELVATAGRLKVLVESLLREERIALDTEGNSFHRYPEQLCLVQIGASSGTYVIDPIAIDDPAPLGALLAEPRVEKVVHSADYDLRSLDREWGFRVRNLFDTSIAAKFTGAQRLGLDTVLVDVLGVEISKDTRLKRSDWSIRPLFEAALEYAADDVAHLLELRDSLSRRLASLGRQAWVAEECARMEEVRYSPPDPPEVAFLSMKGSRKLDGRGLAVLRELVVFRDAEARRRGVPPYRVVSNDALLFLAQSPGSDLADAPGLGETARRRIGRALLAAVRAGGSAQPVSRPLPLTMPEPRPTQAQLDRFQALKRWRTEQGERLGLDPALIWPMASLELLARSPQALAEELSSSTAVRRWQRAEFSASLRQRLLGL